MPVYYTKVDSPGHEDVRFSGEKSRRFSLGLKNKFRRGSAVELSNIDSNFPLISCPRVDQSLDANEEVIESCFGNILVAHQGAPLRDKKPVIVTFHDLGLNHASNFDSFFELGDNKLLLQSFSVLHITAPGQERYASTLPDGYAYPTMDQMPLIVKDVVDHFQVKSLIGFGAGVGSHVLLRFTLLYPEIVEGLILVNPSTDKANWSEWFFQKKNIRAIRNNNRSSLLPASVQQFLMWYHYGSSVDEREQLSKESMQIYSSLLKGIQLNPHNLSLLIESYITRGEIRICREIRETQPKCQIALICGAFSPQISINDSVLTNAKLDPAKTTWIKMSDAGMVLEEKPFQVARILRLFLQGIGYTLKAYDRQRALMSGTSMPCLLPSSSDSSMHSASLFEC